MKEATSRSAVGYFSDNAAEFHSLYRADAGFAERFEMWSGILDRIVRPGDFALDMGCGAGIFSFHMASRGAEVVGIDAADGMLAFCEARRSELGFNNIRFVKGRLPNLDEKGLTGASVLISSSVIEYVEDLQAAVALFSRLLAPRGTMVLSMPNRSSLSRNFQRMKFALTGKPDVYRYIRHFSSPGALARRAEPYGFQLCESHYYAHTTRLAKVLHRMRLPQPLYEDLFVVVLRRGMSALNEQR